jgi:hypothetical protein
LFSDQQQLMESNLPTELILSHPQASLGEVQLEGNPQPGAYLEVSNQTYRVLERKHRYHLRNGRYQLHKIALYVQRSYLPQERSWLAGRWVIGDLNCYYNARSEVLRCAVNPDGPCQGCPHYRD